MSKRLYSRITNYFNNQMVRDSHVDRWLFRHSQRFNHFKFVPVASLFFWMGTMTFYYVWKTQVVEPKWV